MTCKILNIYLYFVICFKFYTAKINLPLPGYGFQKLIDHELYQKHCHKNGVLVINTRDSNEKLLPLIRRTYTESERDDPLKQQDTFASCQRNCEWIIVGFEQITFFADREQL